MKKNQGITLIALVITIIVLLILAGITINLTIGSNGIISMSRKAKEEHEIGEILDRLELEKLDLLAKKEGEIPTVKEYVDYVTQKGIIDDTEEIDENNSYVTVGNYIFLIEKEADGNIKITYQEKVNNDSNEPRPVKIIKLNKETLELQKGQEETLTATIFPKTATNKEVVWSSSNEEVATVDNSGKVTAVKEGEADITATAANRSGISASCKVTVTMPEASIGATGTTHSVQTLIFDWDELGQIAKKISDNYGTGEGQINSDTAEVSVKISGKSQTIGMGDTTILNGKTVRIIGFNHDTLTNPGVYGGNNTYAGITFEYVDILQNARLAPGGTMKWSVLEIRTTTLPKILNGLSIKDKIKEVKKEFYAAGGSKEVTDDKLWLFSCGELWNNKGRGVAIEGKQYKYFKNNSQSNIKKYGSSNAAWWLRSRDPSDTYTFCVVKDDGSCWRQPCGNEQGVAPGFCI